MEESRKEKQRGQEGRVSVAVQGSWSISSWFAGFQTDLAGIQA